MPIIKNETKCQRTENAIPVMSNSGLESSSFCTDGETGTLPVVGSMASTLRRFSCRAVENAEDGPWKASTELVDTKSETATESFMVLYCYRPTQDLGRMNQEQITKSNLLENAHTFPGQKKVMTKKPKNVGLGGLIGICISWFVIIDGSGGRYAIGGTSS